MINLDRWLNLMSAWYFPRCENTYTHLVAAYSEKHRRYHNLDHIDECLNHLDCVSDLPDCPDEIEMALWFHDAVYVPHRSDNEFKSAVWAEKFLVANGAPAAAIKRVYDLIMATLHSSDAETRDQSFIVDIDLAILGTDPDRYRRFETGVREEYKWVPWMIYRRKRADILAGFLERPRIYQNGCFQDRFESQARANLSAAIEALHDSQSTD